MTSVAVAEFYRLKTNFNLCTRWTLDAKTAKQAGLFAAQYRKAHHGISLEDYLLAATTEQLACPLWTNNKKHYPMNEIILFEGL